MDFRHSLAAELLRVELFNFFSSGSGMRFGGNMDELNKRLRVTPDPWHLAPTQSHFASSVKECVVDDSDSELENELADSLYYHEKHCASPTCNIRWLLPDDIPQLYHELGKLNESHREIGFITNQWPRGVNILTSSSGNGKRFQSAQVQLFKELPDDPQEAADAIFNLPERMSWECLFWKEGGRLSIYDARPDRFFRR